MHNLPFKKKKYYASQSFKKFGWYHQKIINLHDIHFEDVKHLNSTTVRLRNVGRHTSASPVVKISHNGMETLLIAILIMS